MEPVAIKSAKSVKRSVSCDITHVANGVGNLIIFISQLTTKVKKYFPTELPVSFLCVCRYLFTPFISQTNKRSHRRFTHM